MKHGMILMLVAVGLLLGVAPVFAQELTSEQKKSEAIQLSREVITKALADPNLDFQKALTDPKPDPQSDDLQAAVGILTALTPEDPMLKQVHDKLNLAPVVPPALAAGDDQPITKGDFRQFFEGQPEKSAQERKRADDLRKEAVGAEKNANDLLVSPLERALTRAELRTRFNTAFDKAVDLAQNDNDYDGALSIAKRLTKQSVEALENYRLEQLNRFSEACELKQAVVKRQRELDQAKVEAEAVVKAASEAAAKAEIERRLDAGRVIREGITADRNEREDATTIAGISGALVAGNYANALKLVNGLHSSDLRDQMNSQINDVLRAHHSSQGAMSGPAATSSPTVTTTAPATGGDGLALLKTGRWAKNQ